MDHVSLMRLLYPAGAVCAVVLAVGYVVDQVWWRAGLAALVAVSFGVTAVIEHRRRRTGRRVADQPR